MQSEPFTWVISNCDSNSPNYTLPNPELGYSQLLKTTDRGNNTLHFAALGQESKILNFIMGIFPHLMTIPNYSGEYPLHWACRAGCVDNVKLLLKHGGSLSYRDNSKNTPFHTAVESGNYDVVQYLLENESIDILQKNGKQLSPLDIACQEGDIETIKLLIFHGANVDSDLFALYCSKKDIDIILALNTERKISRWVACHKKFCVAKMLHNWHL